MMTEVLLATHNGEKYLREQLDSLLNQSEQDFKILARDDGSTDDTLKILSDYETRFPQKIKIIKDDKNCGGAAQNFMELTMHASADYVMFSDQDDVWCADKIKISLESMKKAEEVYGKNMPVLVFTKYVPVDQNLNEIKRWHKWERDRKCTEKQVVNQAEIYTGNNAESHVKNRSENYNGNINGNLAFNRLLVQNYVSGCLIMMNKSLYTKLGNYDDSIIMHDWWAALVASAIGKIVFSDTVTMLYRQHTDNTLGDIDTKSFSYMWRRLGDPNTKTKKYLYKKQAELLCSRFADELPQESQKIVTDFLAVFDEKSKIKRIKKLIKGGYLKGNFVQKVGQIMYI